MRIAFVSTMAAVPWGGSEELWAQAAREAVKAGHDVMALIHDWQPRPAKVMQLAEHGITLRFWKESGAHPEMNRLQGRHDAYPYEPLIEFNPDAIVLSHGGLLDVVNGHYLLLALLFELACPYFVVIQANTELYKPDEEQYPILKRYYTGARKLLFVSRQNQAIARRQLADALDNSAVINNPVNTASFHPVAYPAHLQPSFACVARLDVYCKGQDLLLQALAEWRTLRSENRWSLHLYGEGPDEQYLRRLVEHYGLKEHVHFEGQAHDIRALWAKHHLLILPSRIEGMPLVVFEAMLCGRPAVITDIGGSADWITEGETGFISPAPTVPLIRAAIDRAWERRSDWGLMGKAAFKQFSTAHERIPGKSLLAYVLSGTLGTPLELPEPPTEDGLPSKSLDPVPTVSVIIPSYNYAHFLSGCLDTVLAQTYRDYEIIIVNPSSTDSTTELTAELRTKHPPLRILHQPNYGQPAYSRNNGIRAARGEYILCFDADDLLIPEMLEKTVAALDGDPESSVAYTMLKCFEGSEEIGEKGPFTADALKLENRLAYCSLFRKSAWEQVGGYRVNLAGYEDWDFWLTLVESGLKGIYIPEILLLYRVQQQSYLTSAERNKDRLLAQLVLNHPTLYPSEIVDGARATLPEQSEDIRRGFGGIPRVSVVITCYNHAQYLRESVESVIAQSIAEWELIIVDDGSSDNTRDVALELMGKYPDRDIRLFQKPNSGLASARNAGIRAAWAEYVYVLDADDRIAPTLLEKLARELDTRQDVGFAYADITHFGAQHDTFRYPDFDAFHEVYVDNIVCGNSLLRRSMWEQVGGYNEAMREGYEDWDFWVSCIERGWLGYCVHEPLFHYRKHETSMLVDANVKRQLLRARIIVNHPISFTEKDRQSAADYLAMAGEACPSTA